MKSSTALFALALTLSLGSCDLEFPEQEVQLAYDAEADTLDALLVYRGVVAGEGLEAGVEAAQRILEGRRELMLLDWPFYWDVDDLAAQDDLGPLARRAVDAVGLIEVGAFLDPAGRLSGYQHVRIEGFQALIDAAQAELARKVLAAAAAGVETAGGDLPDPDERTRELWIERAKTGFEIVRITDRGLEVDLPVSPAYSAKLLREVISATRTEPDDPFGPNVFRNLREIHQDEDRLLLVFGRVEDGRIHFDFTRSDVEYDASLREALEEGDLIDLEGAPSLDEVRTRLAR